jgi:hypothetical protein
MSHIVVRGKVQKNQFDAILRKSNRYAAKTGHSEVEGSEDSEGETGAVGTS